MFLKITREAYIISWFLMSGKLLDLEFCFSGFLYTMFITK
jgi:hypothetical protein